jgi:PKD repeat protein
MDFEPLIPLSRRDALKSLGALSLGTTGAAGYNAAEDSLLETQGNCSGATQLPAQVTHERYQRDIDQEDDVNGIEMLLTRGIKQVNVRAVDENQVYETQCGDKPGIEHRFVATGLGYSLLEHSTKGLLGLGLIDETNFEVDLEGDGACGDASLSVNSVFTRLGNPWQGTSSPEDFLAEDRPNTTEALRNRVDELFRQGVVEEDEVPSDFKAWYAGASTALGVGALLVPPAAPVLGAAGSVVSVASVLEAFSNADYENVSEIDPTSIKQLRDYGGSHQLGLYMADFTVRVPEGETATVTVAQEHVWDAYKFRAPETQDIFGDRVEYEIEIPPNEADTPISEANPSELSLAEGPVEYDDDLVVPGGLIRFDLPGDDSNPVREHIYGNLTWYVDGEYKKDTDDRAETGIVHRFDDDGFEHIEGHTEVPADSLKPDARYDLKHTFQVGEAPCTPEPSAYFEYDVRGSIDQLVEFDASGSYAPGDIEAYHWTITATDGETTHRFTDEDETLVHTFGTVAVWRVELRVIDAEGQSDRYVEFVGPDKKAPVAAFSYSPNPAEAGTTFGLDASASRAPAQDTEITKYEWETLSSPDPGAGDPPNGKRVDWKFLQPGGYTVRLTVTDSNKNTDSVEQTVDVDEKIESPPNARFTYSPQQPEARDDVTLDGSGSTAREDGATIESYDWEIIESANGDPPSTEQPTWSFIQPGSYTVQLTVTDSNENRDTAQEIINVSEETKLAPEAQFTYSPYQPKPGETVTLDASDSTAREDGATIESYEWEIPGSANGDPTNGEQPTWSFVQPDYYTVQLTVTDNHGNRDTAEETIDVEGYDDPIARISGPTDADVGDSVTFDASSSSAPDGHIDSYDWGGATSGYDRTTTETFSRSGSQTVTVSVEDSNGNVDTASHTVDVTEPPDPEAHIDVSPSTPEVEEEATITASYSDAPGGTIVSYDWGGAVGGSSETIQETWYQSGYETLELEVTDSNGNTDSTSKTISIASDGGAEPTSWLKDLTDVGRDGPSNTAGDTTRGDSR